MDRITTLSVSSIDEIPARALVEWPTLGLTLCIFGGWIGLTLAHHALPAALVLPAAAWLIAWHSSLQHEIIHGHPTASRRLNRAIGFVPLSLWMPFARYRAMHLAHHRDERLTDPLDDPESYYWAPADWQALPPPARVLVAAQTTLAGRLLIGPFWAVGRFLARDFSAILQGDRALRRVWSRHALGVAAVLAWLWLACGIDPLTYLALYLYPGTALLMLRSFAEHRAEDAVAHRSAIVERAPILGLLFLNNNLHAAHHARPTLPWYRLPAWYAKHRDSLMFQNGGLIYRGYGDVAGRYLLRPHHAPPHPRGRAPGGWPDQAPRAPAGSAERCA